MKKYPFILDKKVITKLCIAITFLVSLIVLYVYNLSRSYFMWPTQGTITQKPMWFHMALDISDWSKPPIVASQQGIVTEARCGHPWYGCYVVINHDNGYQTLYGHLQKLMLVKKNDVVSKGQKIGNMGSTGRSSYAHLHFEIKYKGALMNPLMLLKKYIIF